MKKRMIIIVIIFTIIVTSVITYSYSNQIENSVADLPFAYEVVYDFEDDIIGEHPEGFSGWSWDGTEIIDLKDGTHNKVAEVANRDGEGVELATRFKKAVEGIIEFDIYLGYDEIVNIDICQTNEDYDSKDDICIHLGVDGYITIKDGIGRFVKVLSFSEDTWYHFKIIFNLEYWELWIDGNRITDDYQRNLFYNFNHYEEPPYFCQLYFSTYMEDNQFYVDNIEITVIEII